MDDKVHAVVEAARELRRQHTCELEADDCVCDICRTVRALDAATCETCGGGR